MVRAAIAFFVLALFAYVLGANGIAGLSVELGRILLYVFLILAAISIVGSFFTGKNPKILPAFLLFGLFCFGDTAKAVETVLEKAETIQNKTMDRTKSAYRNIEDKVCETINGELKCVPNKAKHKLNNFSDSVKTEANDLKNKMDN